MTEPSDLATVAPVKRPAKARRNYVMTPARIAANRVRRWKHGKRSLVVTELEGRMAQLRKIDPKLPEILEACVAAIAGDLDPYQKIGITALFEAEVVRRASMDEIGKRGLIIEESVWGEDGAKLGTKLKANPLLDNTRRLYDTLGFTAEQMQLSRRSRGQGAKDEAKTHLLTRQAMLRSVDKSKMLGPGADPIDVTNVGDDSTD